MVRFKGGNSLEIHLKLVFCMNFREVTNWNLIQIGINTSESTRLPRIMFLR